jgi:signal recognition particle GTPase
MFKLFNNKKETQTPPSTTPESAPDEAPNAGLFSRMKQAVSRTRESFSVKIENLVALTHTVDEKALEDLEAALLTSDLGVQTSTAILEALRDRARHQAIEGGEELRELLKAQIRAILEAPIANRPCRRPQRDLPRRRQRHRKNHLSRQAGRLVSRTESHGSALRRRHLPRRGNRAARSLGHTLRR